VFRVWPVGSTRLYVTVPTADFHSTQPYTADETLVELIAFDVGTWRELARRPGHLGLGLTLARP
jgi:hypothetical protein